MFSLTLNILGLTMIYIQDEDLKRCIEESSRIRDEFQNYFDLEIKVEDFQETYRTLLDAVNKLSTESQWVPLNWVYS